MKREKFLEESQRAEDILLGSLGFAEEAHITTLERTADGYRGKGRFTDGADFEFTSDDELDELHEWALQILLGKVSRTAKSS